MEKLRIVLLGLLLLVVSCDDKLNPDSLYTFRKTNVAEYFRDNPEFSIFYKFLQIAYNTPNKNSSTVASLLGTVGNYTVFAPKDDAMKIYLDSIYGEDNYIIDTISRETANRVVLNCVIDMGTYKPLKQSKFHEGTVNEPTLDGHHLIIHWNDDGSCIINGKGKLISKFDIELYNGVIHIVDHVLPPAPNTVSGIIAAAEHLRIFNHLLEITSWADSMLLFEDKKYVPSESIEPKFRLYGYTAFVEADSIFAKDWGVPMPVIDEEDGHVSNMEEIMAVITQRCREAYPDATDGDWKSRNNAINRFVSYHLLDIKATYDNIIRHDNEGNNEDCYHNPIVNRWNYFKTRGTTRLVKPTYVIKENTIYLNRHCGYDNTFLGDYHETYCDHEGVKVYRPKDYLENYAANGYYWLINHVLLYDHYTRNVVLNERIRFDVEQTLPEIYNGKLNASYDRGGTSYEYSLKPGFLSNLISGNNFEWSCAHNDCAQKTLLLFISPKDSHPIYYKLLPVPYSGTWELRLLTYMMVLHNRKNYISQPIARIWIGTTTQVNKMKELGTFDMRHIEITKTPLGKFVYHSKLNFKTDENLEFDSVACFEIDKNLRVHGQMKGPKYYFRLRRNYLNRRYIICRHHFEADKEYWIRFQILSGHFPLDAFEFCPSNIYDNPDKAEDVW